MISSVLIIPSKYSLDEAKKVVQKLKIRNSREYYSKYKGDIKLVRSPQLFYKDQWKGWADFLGKEKK